jgi:hypothetical protein
MLGALGLKSAVTDRWRDDGSRPMGVSPKTNTPSVRTLQLRKRVHRKPADDAFKICLETAL